MATPLAVCKILGWTVKHASHFRSDQFTRNQLPGLWSHCRMFCSSQETASLMPSSNTSVVRTEKPPRELSLAALLEMGFTKPQAERMHESMSSSRKGSSSRGALATLTVLFVMGLNPSSVEKLLGKCPEIYAINETQLQQRISYLRKLGLVEGSLQRMVVHYPKSLTLPIKSVKNVVKFLKEKCLFTTQQVTEILRNCPAVILEDLDQLEYKFQYVYFRMGVKQAEMVKHKLFRFSLDDIRCRHTFLERRGLYQTPDKKGQTTIINPKLDSILEVDQKTFVTCVAQATLEEYDVFQRLLEREHKEDELQRGKIEACSDDEAEVDDDYDTDEEEDAKGKYRFRKKK